MQVYEVRRKNIELLIEQYKGQAALSRACKKAAPFIHQITSGIKNCGERVSRDIEKELGLPANWLDQPRELAATTTEFPVEKWNQLNKESQSLVINLIEVLIYNGSITTEEKKLISAFRECTSKEQSVVLSVAMSQAAMPSKESNK